MKSDRINQYFQHVDTLVTPDTPYADHLDALFLWLCETDAVTHDITTLSLGLTGDVTAQIITRDPIVVSGVSDICYLLQKHTSIKASGFISDTSSANTGGKIVHLEGSIRDILKYERTILNILQRTCGISTYTQKMISSIHNTDIFLSATRKTPWNEIDKKAVAQGGGLTHRLNMSDGILVKDNHIEQIKHSGIPPQDVMAHIIHAYEKKGIHQLIEIEVETLEQVKEVIQAWLPTSSFPLCLLLDNMSPDQIYTIISSLPLDQRSEIIFEASGGIRPDTLPSYASSGVDIISCGFLTHSAQAADLSLDITS